MTPLMERNVHLLIFAADGGLYGGHADQIDEILEADEGVIRAKRGALQIVRIAARLGSQPPQAAASNGVAQARGRILVIKRGGETLGLFVEQVQQLIALPVGQIHALPPLMQARQQTQAVWGIALLRGLPVILLDFEQL